MRGARGTTTNTTGFLQLLRSSHAGEHDDDEKVLVDKVFVGVMKTTIFTRRRRVWNNDSVAATDDGDQHCRQRQLPALPVAAVSTTTTTTITTTTATTTMPTKTRGGDDDYFCGCYQQLLRGLYTWLQYYFFCFHFDHDHAHTRLRPRPPRLAATMVKNKCCYYYCWGFYLSAYSVPRRTTHHLATTATTKITNTGAASAACRTGSDL